MTHENFTEKISLWLDNDLNAAEVAELQAHLSGCSTCQWTYRRLQRVDALLRAGAKRLVAPAPGFEQRFEARLALYRAGQRGHLWLGLGVLLLSTLLFFIVGGVMAGAFVNAGLSTIGVSLLYDGLASFIESANLIGVWLNLAGLFIKACLITMSRPLFWGCVAAAVAMVWLWGRLLQAVYRRATTQIGLLI